MKAVNLLSAYADKLELNIKELDAQLDESRRECEKLKTELDNRAVNPTAVTPRMVRMNHDLTVKLQSSLAENAAMRVALEFVDKHLEHMPLECASDCSGIVRKALSHNATNPILDAMRAAKETLNFYGNRLKPGDAPYCFDYKSGEPARQALAQLSTALGNEEGK